MRTVFFFFVQLSVWLQTFNCIFCLLAAHLSVQLKLLAHSLEEIISGGFGGKEGEKDNRMSLASAVERHQKLLG